MREESKVLHELEQYSPGDWFYDVGDQLKRHIYERSERAFAAGDAARDAMTTREALAARQEEIRRHIVECLGGLPSSETPLDARTVGTLQGPGFQVERVIFQSRPGHYVTANLYLPDERAERTAAVLFLCGHHDQAKHQPEYQTVCQYLCQAGLIVLAQDPIGQGERLGYYEPSLGRPTVRCGTMEHDTAGAQCLPLGDTLARYFLHDAMRSIDYLQSRPEVDASRIGVTGNSGGGTQTSLMMLADTRIAAAVPATFIMSRHSYMLAGGAQDAEQIWPGFTSAGFDHEDILLAMTPRPVRVLAVTSDFFPIEGTRRTVDRCKRLWSLFGRDECIDLVEDVSSHAYTPRLARAAGQFFARHLLGREAVFDEERIQPFEPNKLWCTKSGQVRGEIEGAVSVQETTRERMEALARQRSTLNPSERRSKALDWLRERAHKDRLPCDLNPRFLIRRQWEDLDVQSAVWWSQEGLFSHAFLFRDGQTEQPLPVTLAIWDGGTNSLKNHADWLRSTCRAGRAALVLDVSGAGALSPRSITPQAPDAFYGVIHKFATDLIWLDDDLAALRSWDVLRSLDMIQQWPGVDASDISVYAHGRHGLYGRMAGLLDPRIRHVEVEAGMTGYADWVGSHEYDTKDIYSIILRGVLQHFDLPEISESDPL